MAGARGIVERPPLADADARLVPVILTAASTILGLIPLAIGLNIDFAGLFTSFEPHLHFGGDNVAFFGPLSWTIIFGLTFATFLTLIMIPVMYHAIYTWDIWQKRKISQIKHSDNLLRKLLD
jgi:multidrug efflux pump subunit AcrB